MRTCECCYNNFDEGVTHFCPVCDCPIGSRFVDFMKGLHSLHFPFPSNHSYEMGRKWALYCKSRDNDALIRNFVNERYKDKDVPQSTLDNIANAAIKAATIPPYVCDQAIKNALHQLLLWNVDLTIAVGRYIDLEKDL